MTAQAAEYTAAAEKLFSGDTAPLENPLFNLGADLMSEFALAQSYRRELEVRWLQDLRQYKGIYEPEEEKRLEGRSKAFLRKTRVKVESVDARMMDLLFPANRDKNFELTATPDPKIAPELRHRLKNEMAARLQRTPTQAEIQKGVRIFVQEAAKKMATRIDDQLGEANYKAVCRKVLHSGNLYGTGILKGPLVERRARVSYVWDGKRYVQKQHAFAAPFVSYVPIWRWYPDLAVTELADSRYTWEHHRLSRAAFAELASRRTFDGRKIKGHIETHPEGYIKLMAYEGDLQTLGETAKINGASKTGQYDVYERWGWLGGEVLAALGVDVPRDRLHEMFFSNVWVLPDGDIIKAVLAPIEGTSWPYHLYFFDRDETSLFGEGLASIMRDDQSMINSSVRMLLDNAAITCGPQFEVFVPAFPPTANLTDIHPLKVWPRTGGDFQYPAVRQLDFNAHLPELVQVMQLFDTNADETTAIPKFTYGDNPTRGAAGTMGGLSMLLAQANISLKDLVANFDEMTESFIGALYHWNMKFSRDDSIKGDFDVKARGASSLVAKEVKAQMLAGFGATLQPEERAYVNWQKLVRQKAETQDLHDIALTDDEFKEQQNSAEMQTQAQMAEMQAQLQLAQLQATVGKLQAEIQKLGADTGKVAAETERTIAEAVNKRVEAAYAAFQAGGVAATNPTVAPAGDEILRAAGWQDANASAQMPADVPTTPEAPPAAGLEAPEPQNLPMSAPMSDSPYVGERDGIITPEVPQ